MLSDLVWAWRMRRKGVDVRAEDRWVPIQPDHTLFQDHHWYDPEEV